MKPASNTGARARFWAIAGIVVFAAIDLVLVGVAYVHGHPEVQGTPGPILTFSSPVSPSATVGPPSASPTGAKR